MLRLGFSWACKQSVARRACQLDQSSLGCLAGLTTNTQTPLWTKSTCIQNKTNTQVAPFTTICCGHHASTTHRRAPDVILSQRYYSSEPGDEDTKKLLNDLDKRYHDDPEIKEWMKHLRDDFAGDGEVSTTQGSAADEELSRSDEPATDEEDKAFSEDAPSEKSHIDAGMDHLQATPVTDEDIERQLARYDYEEVDVDYEDEEEDKVVQLPISLQRGATGVFDVEELVELLRDENARDICVMSVPQEYSYVDYMVIVSGKSKRHLLAMAEFVKWVYKRKRGAKDPASVRVEGKDNTDWLAIDMGNIALHLMEPGVREKYDLETLWTVGAEFEQPQEDLELQYKNTEDFDWEALLKEAQAEAGERKIEARNRHRPMPTSQTGT